MNHLEKTLIDMSHVTNLLDNGFKTIPIKVFEMIANFNKKILKESLKRKNIIVYAILSDGWLEIMEKHIRDLRKLTTKDYEIQQINMKLEMLKDYYKNLN
jgi:hypothetical protein